MHCFYDLFKTLMNATWAWTTATVHLPHVLMKWAEKTASHVPALLDILAMASLVTVSSLHTLFYCRADDTDTPIA